MDLTPIAPRRYHENDLYRASWQNIIVSYLLNQGVQVVERQLRRVHNDHLENLYNNLVEAAQQGVINLATTFTKLVGSSPLNFNQLAGMESKRRHKWGDPTQPPSTYDEEGLIFRVKTLEKLVKTWTDKYLNAKEKDKGWIHAELRSRLKESDRWQDYFRQKMGISWDNFNLDRNLETPQTPGNGGAAGGPEDLVPNRRRPADEQLEAPPRDYRPETPQQVIPPENDVEFDNLENNDLGDLFNENWRALQRSPEFEAFARDPFQLLDPVQDNMASGNVLAGAAGGGSAMAQPCGVIKKNPPSYSDDGSTVTFSGSRQMYTWAFNYSEQKNPFAYGKVNLAFNAPGTSVVKPLGHTLPWDWNGFYCTPAEWESLNWGTHRIEVEEVGVRVTPIDKSVFFTTGSSQTNPVSTEHAAYVFKMEEFPQGVPILAVQPKNEKSGIDWTGNDNLAPLSYLRLRDRLWGPKVRGSTGFSCMDGVKRELEPILGMLLDDTSSYPDYGSSTFGEFMEVYPITEAMGKPFIKKVYRPKNGLVYDPQIRVIHTKFEADKSSMTSTPNYLPSPLESQLKEAALLLHKHPVSCMMVYNNNFQQGSTTDKLYYSRDSAAFSLYKTKKEFDPSLSQDNIVYGTITATTGQATNNTEYTVSPAPTTIALRDAASGSVPPPGMFPILESTSSDGKPNSPYPAASLAVHVASSKDDRRLMYPKLTTGGSTFTQVSDHIDIVCAGQQALGCNSTSVQNSFLPLSGKQPQQFMEAYSSTSDPKSKYSSWVQSATLDKDTDLDYGDGSNTYTLSSWHSKIEKGNSFLPFEADRDCFPDPIPEQPRFVFGVKPVIASDPNNGNTDFLKTTVNWKIDYYMKIKQTYVKPQLRFVERRATNSGKTGPQVLPLKAEYSLGIPKRGMEISVIATGKYTDGSTEKTVTFDASDLNPMQRELTIDGKLIRTIRTAPLLHPEDTVTFDGSTMGQLTSTPAVLGLQKLV